MEKIRSMLLHAVPGEFSLAMHQLFLHAARFQHHQCCHFLLVSCLITGALSLDGWKSKFQKSHLFGARLSFISRDFDLYSLVCLCDAGMNSFQPDSFSMNSAHMHMFDIFLSVESKGLPQPSDTQFLSGLINLAVSQFQQNASRFVRSCRMVLLHN